MYIVSKDAVFKCLKFKIDFDIGLSRVFLRGTWRQLRVDDGSSHEIDEKELRAYETRGDKRETGACDIEFRY